MRLALEPHFFIDAYMASRCSARYGLAPSRAKHISNCKRKKIRLQYIERKAHIDRRRRISTLCILKCARHLVDMPRGARLDMASRYSARYGLAELGSIWPRGARLDMASRSSARYASQSSARYASRSSARYRINSSRPAGHIERRSLISSFEYLGFAGMLETYLKSPREIYIALCFSAGEKHEKKRAPQLTTGRDVCIIVIGAPID